MKTLAALSTGLKRSIKIWKGILIVWFVCMSLVAFLVIPFRSSMKAGFGSSMITEELLNGINIEILSDLAPVTKSLMSLFSTGLFIALLLGIIMNAFLSGGLFNSIKAGAGRFSASDFFKASARNFWSFLLITLVISVVIVLLLLFIFIVPVALVAQAEPDTERVLFLTGIIAGSVFIFILIIFLLVTDYARAWNVTRETPSGFKAIGFGLSRTFGRFRSSFPLMLVIGVIQVLFGAAVIYLVGVWKPVTGWGVFLLFLVSQALFIIKILIKTWRYASVTNLMELNDKTTTGEVINL